MTRLTPFGHMRYSASGVQPRMERRGRPFRIGGLRVVAKLGHPEVDSWRERMWPARRPRRGEPAHLQVPERDVVRVEGWWVGPPYVYGWCAQTSNSDFVAARRLRLERRPTCTASRA